MNILITGGTGLVGKALVEKLESRGHDVRVLTRHETDHPKQFIWNVSEKYIDEKAFDNLDCVIHLAGATISHPWKDSYKKKMYSSRVDAANLILEYCNNLKIALLSFISASGINYYGTLTSDVILTEESPVIQNDFLANLCVDWEKAAHQFSSISERVVCLRTSMVLAKKEGAFPLLKSIVNFNIGSPVGSGKQWMNWIHLDDLVNMYVFSVENTPVKGNYNALADEYVTNNVFMKKLASASKKFFLPIHVPAFLLKILMGEMSSIILKGTRADNQKIKSLGFDFKYKKLDEAFKNLI